MGTMQRRKGHNFERTIVNVFKDFGLEAKRNLQYQEGHSASDVIIKLKEYILLIECKCRRKVNIKQAYQQVLDTVMRENEIPCAVTKEDREDVLVTLSLNDFFKILGLEPNKNVEKTNS